ncbi:hypothetical protein Syun_006422 [Stephania yunnanensis]|uniref:F-box domain-containing protein n=1 Tax=Stephania yunnanensis TaxID=152371 RepID=A0AAP0KWV1_9MAGN
MMMMTSKSSSEKTSEYLPLDLLQEILFRSPVKSLARLKHVSKSWYTLITDPNFIYLHLNRSLQHNKFSFFISNSNNLYSIDQDPTATTQLLSDHPQHRGFQVKASCDGLLLLLLSLKSSESKSKVFLRIWNPSTGEFINIPAANEYVSNYNRETYGFGYGPYGSNRKDYKVLVVARSANADKVKIFSTASRSRTWRVIKDSRIEHNNFHKNIVYDRQGVFVMGAFHWLVFGFNLGDVPKDGRIITFDFECEKFNNIQTPKPLDFINENLRLSMWRENLCLFVQDLRDCSSHIFVMKEYGARDSWCKMYSIPDQTLKKYKRYRLWSMVCFIDDGKILLQHEHVSRPKVVLYDTKSCKFDELELREDLESVLKKWSDVYAYVPSLVPIKDITR